MSKSTRVISVREDALAAAAFAVILAGMAGCAARQPSILNPSPIPPPGSEAKSLMLRSRLLTSLQTAAIMDYSGPTGHLKAREQLTARRPASLRVDAMSPLGVALIVAANDSQITVFDPSNNVLIRGAANASTLARFTRIPMPPAQAVQLLLGLAPDQSVLVTAPSNSWTEGKMKIESYTGSDGTRYELGLSDSELALVRARDAAGRMTYEVHYSDYRDIGALRFPVELKAWFPATATTIELRYLNPIIDGQISDSSFTWAEHQAD
jgi:Domain of unknown function (DUF4292)